MVEHDLLIIICVFCVNAEPSETVRVKFKLEKKCKFGEQFLLVGDDSMLGFWNPSWAIPMNWSAGDVWTAELVRIKS